MGVRTPGCPTDLFPALMRAKCRWGQKPAAAASTCLEQGWTALARVGARLHIPTELCLATAWLHWLRAARGGCQTPWLCCRASSRGTMPGLPTAVPGSAELHAVW